MGAAEINASCLMICENVWKMKLWIVDFDITRISFMDEIVKNETTRQSTYHFRGDRSMDIHIGQK